MSAPTHHLAHRPPRIVRVLAGALAAAAFSTAAVVPAAAADEPAGEPGGALTAAEVDVYMADYLDSASLPGAAVTVTRGSEVVRAAGYGHDSTGAAMTADTPMGLASVSKAFTALAVMQLVEAGKVGMDRPVVRYLPEFATADPRSDAITVEQLLTQTSGMSDQGFREKSEPAPESLKGAVARLSEAELVAEPGTEVNYHNPNYHVAARLVEAVSGEPFADYLDRHVYTPLGMDDTVTVDTAAEVFEQGGAATGHIAAIGLPAAIGEPASFFNGAGGMVSTARDMAAWLIAQQNQGRGPDGTRVLSAEGIETTRTAPGEGDPHAEKALGWNVRETPGGAPMIEHGGIQFTYTAYQVVLPESGYGIAVMADTGLGRGDAQAITAGLVALTEGAGEPPGSSAAALLAVDAAMGVAAVLTVLLGVRGVRRSGPWARARAGRARWVTALRLLPYAVLAGAALTVNRLVAPLAGGRDITWLQSFYVAPTAWVWLLIGAAACAAVLTARVVHLARRGRGTQVDLNQG